MEVWIVLVEERFRWEGHEVGQPDVTERVEIRVGGVFGSEPAARAFVKSERRGSEYGRHFHVERHEVQSGVSQSAG